MTNERWEKLKTVTWFREEQDEVTEYVERLIAAQNRCLITGTPLGTDAWNREPACSCVNCKGLR